MARFLLYFRTMATTPRTDLVRSATKALTILLMTLTTASCPYPVQYPLEPDEENEPPVINSEYTMPYIVMTDPVEELALPQFLIVVDDPNASDTLAVKIIKDLDQSWLPANPTVPHQVLVSDEYIRPVDTLAPEDASNMGVPETTRSKQISLRLTPCVTGSAGQKVFLWVCVTDDAFEAPPVGYPNENPCIPHSGFVDTYPVVVSCIPQQ
jgi:hypothetical protein